MKTKLFSTSLVLIALVLFSFQNCGIKNQSNGTQNASSDGVYFANELEGYEAATTAGVVDANGVTWRTDWTSTLDRAYMSYVYYESYGEIRNLNAPTVFQDVSAPYSTFANALFAGGLTVGCLLNSNGTRNYCPTDTLPVWQLLVMKGRAIAKYDRGGIVLGPEYETQARTHFPQEIISAFAGDGDGLEALELAYQSNIFTILGKPITLATLNANAVLSDAVKIATTNGYVGSCRMTARCPYKIYHPDGTLFQDSYAEVLYTVATTCNRNSARSNIQRTLTPSDPTWRVENQTCRVVSSQPQ